MQIKAIACDLPATLGVPLSRLSTADIVREAQRAGLVATISDTTVWRWLPEDAIRPWQPPHVDLPARSRLRRHRGRDATPPLPRLLREHRDPL